MNVGDIVVYDGPLMLACGHQYFYVYKLDVHGQKVDLIQISMDGAGWWLSLPKSKLTIVGHVSRLLTPDDMWNIGYNRTVPNYLLGLLQPWLGNRPPK